MEERIIQLISDILKVNVNKDSMREDIEQWDSLKHLHIIVELEEKLNIEIPIEEVAEIQKISDIFKYINNY